MTTAEQRRRPGQDDDEGVSLVELLVTMMVTAIVLTIVGNMFVTVAKVTTESNLTSARSGVAATIMGEISEVVRGAVNNAVAGNEVPDTAVVSGTPTALTMYSLIDANPAAPAPIKIGFRLDAAGNLIEDRWTATASSGYWVFTGAVTSRMIGGPVASLTGANAMFVYLDEHGLALTPGANGLTPAQRLATASIRVSVRIANQGSTASDPILLVNNVGMPNLKFSRTDD
jgi:hypothetical protein